MASRTLLQYKKMTFQKMLPRRKNSTVQYSIVQ